MIRWLIHISFIAILTWSFTLASAEARRFGGGRSIGTHRSLSHSAINSVKPVASQIKSATQKKWLGAVLGLVAGALIASLLFNHGLLSAALVWGGIALLTLLLFKFLLARKTQPTAVDSNHHHWQINDEKQPLSFNNEGQNPEAFDTPQFLQQVKTQFIRLQAAYDQKNLSDIREFTTPQVFAEIQLQLQEENRQDNFTEVLTINADLLDMQNNDQQGEASVQFKGEVREEKNQPPVQINEIWHFKKDIWSSKWLVSGIQQG